MSIIRKNIISLRGLLVSLWQNIFGEPRDDQNREHSTILNETSNEREQLSNNSF